MKYFSITYVLVIMCFSAFSVRAQFQKLDLPEDVTYNDVYFSTPSTGFILGTKGTFLKTTDTGATWQKIEMDTLLNLNRVHFPTPEIGYISGTGILKTIDGGKVWTIINTKIGGGTIYFTTPEIGYTIGFGGGIAKTIDGGLTWKLYEVPVEIYNIQFPTRNTGYAVGRFAMFKTTDGGESWITINNSLIKYRNCSKILIRIY